MLEFISKNLSTIIITLVILVLVVFGESGVSSER